MLEQVLREGVVFHEKYQVVREMAKGGMGAVYEVVHLETQRRRALKVMLPSVLGSEELRNRFRAEARVASSIESEHIVETFDAGIDRATNMPFLVMELLRGQELADAIENLGRFAPDRALPLLGQISRTLDKTHAARVVHRDLKPENIFLTAREDGTSRVKILDFGIAKIVAEGGKGDGTKSLGTPLYMAPEQFDSSTPISAQTDLYALAHITYTMLAGRSYFTDEQTTSASVYAFLMATQNGVTEPPSQRAARYGASLPPAFDAWFARATARRAGERFSSGAEQQAALQQVFQGVAVAQSGPQPSFAQTAFAPPLAMQSGPQPAYGSSGPQPGYASGPQPAYGSSGPQPGYAASGHTGGGVPGQTVMASGTMLGPSPIAPAATTGARGFTPPLPTAKKKKSSLAWLWALIALVVVGGGIAAALVVNDQPSGKKKKNQTTSKSSGSEAVVPAPVADDPDTIVFTKKDHVVGSSVIEHQSSELDLDATKPRVIEYGETEKSSRTTTILAADGKTVLKVKVRYGEITKTVSIGEEEKNEPSPCSNKTYVAEYRDGAIVVTDESYNAVTAEEEKQVRGDNKHLGKPDPSLVALPDVPLKRGDRADTIAELLRGAGQDGDADFSDVSVTLKDIQVVDGVKRGVFELSFTTSTKPGAAQGMKFVAKGEMTLRADNGRNVLTTLDGPVVMSGGVDATGTISMRFEEE